MGIIKFQSSAEFRLGEGEKKKQKNAPATTNKPKLDVHRPCPSENEASAIAGYIDASHFDAKLRSIVLHRHHRLHPPRPLSLSSQSLLSR